MEKIILSTAGIRDTRPCSVTLRVNSIGDLVKFFLFSTRGDGQRIFWAKNCNARSGHVYHLHRKFAPGETTDVEMVVTLIGSPSADGVGQAVLFCQACGLRVIVPEDGLSAEELDKLFREFKPSPHYSSFSR